MVPRSSLNSVICETNTTVAASLSRFSDLPVRKCSPGAATWMLSPSNVTSRGSAARTRDRGIAKPAKSQLLRLIRMFRAGSAIKNSCPSIIHANHQYRVDMSFANGKRQGQGEQALAQPYTGRMPQHGGSTVVPNGSGIVKNLEYAVTILDGIVNHPVSADRIQLVLVPTPKSTAVP